MAGVQVRTRGEEHEDIARAAMGLECREGIGVHPVLEQRRHELLRPPLDLAARVAGHDGADGGGFQRTAVGAAERKRQQYRHHLQKTRNAPGMPAQEAREVGEQCVVPRERAIQIEDRERGSRGIARGRNDRVRLETLQAPPPAAASWRSTYCRIPPCR